MKKGLGLRIEDLGSRKLAFSVFVLVISLVVVFSATTVSAAITLPQPAGFVNDFAGVLSSEQEQQLEDQLTQFEQASSNEIAILIVDSFQGLDRFSFAHEVFTTWGIGKEGKDNGVLFVLGPREGQPFPQKGEGFIEVGRGLEGALPDGLTGSLLRNEIFPFFAQGKIFDGLQAGVSAMIQATKGEYQPQETKTPSSMNNFLANNAIFLVWGAFLLISYLVSFLGRTKSWWLGGVLGGFGGGILGLILLSGLAALISAAFFGVLGFVFDFIVSKNYQFRKSQGKPTDFWHSGGGFWWGGGGFGGFGGGRSGGGGAGGSW